MVLQQGLDPETGRPIVEDSLDPGVAVRVMQEPAGTMIAEAFANNLRDATLPVKMVPDDVSAATNNTTRLNAFLATGRSVDLRGNTYHIDGVLTCVSGSVIRNGRLQSAVSTEINVTGTLGASSLLYEDTPMANTTVKIATKGTLAVDDYAIIMDAVEKDNNGNTRPQQLLRVIAVDAAPGDHDVITFDGSTQFDYTITAMATPASVTKVTPIEDVTLSGLTLDGVAIRPLGAINLRLTESKFYNVRPWLQDGQTPYACDRLHLVADAEGWGDTTNTGFYLVGQRRAYINVSTRGFRESVRLWGCSEIYAITRTTEALHRAVHCYRCHDFVITATSTNSPAAGVGNVEQIQLNYSQRGVLLNPTVLGCRSGAGIECRSPCSDVVIVNPHIYAATAAQGVEGIILKGSGVCDNIRIEGGRVVGFSIGLVMREACDNIVVDGLTVEPHPDDAAYLSIEIGKFMIQDFNNITIQNCRIISESAVQLSAGDITNDDRDGTHTGGNDEATLTDTAATWVTNELLGRTVENITDGSSGLITANSGTTITATLSGGTDDDWDTGDVYTIHGLNINQFRFLNNDLSYRSAASGSAISVGGCRGLWVVGNSLASNGRTIALNFDNTDIVHAENRWGDLDSETVLFPAGEEPKIKENFRIDTTGLLTLYERSVDWPNAVQVILSSAGAGLAGKGFGMIGTNAPVGYGWRTAIAGNYDMVITDTQRFGFGQTVPAGKFHVENTTAGLRTLVVIGDGATTADMVQVARDGVEYLVVDTNGNLEIQGSVNVKAGKIKTVPASVTLAPGAVDLPITSGIMIVTGDAGGNTLATLSGATAGESVKLLFRDALVTITDNAVGTFNTPNLAAAFTSTPNDTMTLFYDGTSWFEESRSIN